MLRAVGGIENLVDWNSKSPDIDLLKYMADDRDKEDKVFDEQSLIRLRWCATASQATVGYCPEIWAEWK